MITEDDLIVLTVAMIQKHGVMDTMEIEGKWLKEAADMIENTGEGKVKLAFTSDPQGEFINVTCLFGQKQMDEWDKMGMGRAGMA